MIVSATVENHRSSLAQMSQHPPTTMVFWIVPNKSYCGSDILGYNILVSASPVSASVRAGQSHPVVPASVGNPVTVSLHPALQPGSLQPHVGGAASHLQANYTLYTCTF